MSEHANHAASARRLLQSVTRDPNTNRQVVDPGVSWVLDLLNEMLTVWSEVRPATVKQLTGALKQRLVDAPAARGQGRE